MKKGPEALGTSGIDATGREIVFIKGPDYHDIHPYKALEMAASLELEAGGVQGSAGNAMRERAHELLDHAIQNEPQMKRFNP